MAYAPKRQVCIYVVAEEGSADVSKIGITELLSRRLGTMQSNNWRKLTIPAAYSVSDWKLAQHIETAVLYQLSKFVLRGEWFSVSPERLQRCIEAHLRLLELPVLDLIKTGADTNVINIARRR